jgi:hypothetical protein
MPRRSQQEKPEEIRGELVTLLTNFKNLLRENNLREKVQALVPIYHHLRDLGCSLIPKNLAASARQRILFYFQKYPFAVIPGDEIMVIAGIGEWARRLRELRVQFGWAIVNGVTAKEMSAEGGFPLEHVDVAKLGPDDYILVSERQDKMAAHRWNVANVIRREDLSVRDKILKFLRANVGGDVSGEELRYVAGDKTEWARRVRELRTEEGWPIVTKSTGRPDLSVGAYVLEADRQTPAHDRDIPDEIRCEVLVRDHYTCQKCKWTHAQWNPSDPRHLELHHVKPHAAGGANTAANLITLCNVCHDVIHRKDKKAAG